MLFLVVLQGLWVNAQTVTLVGSGSQTVNNISNFSITLPSGLAIGDLILIQVGYTDSRGSVSAPISMTDLSSGTTGNLNYNFGYRIVDGTEGSTIDYVTSNGNTRDWMGAVIVYRNVNLKSFFEDQDYDANQITKNTGFFTAPASVATSGEAKHVLFAMARHDGTPTSITQPNGMTKRRDLVASNRMLVLADQQLTTSGSTGTKTINFSGNVAGNNNARCYFSASVILRPLRILYSYQSGNFSTNSTWTLDPSGTTLSPAAGKAPSAFDSLVIKNGRNVLLTANTTGNTMGIQLDAGSALDLQGFTLDTLSTLSGSGRLRSSRTTGNITYFPSTHSAAVFRSSGGGIMEYYCAASVTLNTSFTSFHHLELKKETSGTCTYTLDSDLTLTGYFKLLKTGSGVVQFLIGNTATSRTFDITGDIEIQAGTQWRVGTSNVGHQVVARGSFVNYGSVRLTNQTSPNYTTVPTNGYASITFSGASDANLVCNGQTDFYRLILNKGSDQTYLLNMTANDSTNFKLFGANNQANTGVDPNATINKALSLQNGTIKINNNIYFPSLTEGGIDFFINQNVGFWINGGYVVSSVSGTGNRAMTIIGKLRISSGYLFTNQGAGLVYRADALIIIEGGYVEVGQLRRSGTAGTYRASYSQSGGHIYVFGAEDNNGYGRFSIPDADCAFIMSGGLIELQSPTSLTGSANLFQVGVSQLNYSVSGGKIIINTNNAGREATISVPGPLKEVEVRRNGGLTVRALSNLEILDQLFIGSGSPVFDMDNLSLKLYDDLLINSGASLDMGNGTLSFLGSGPQVFDNNGTILGNLYQLEINKSDTLLLSGSVSSLTVTNTFSLLNGIFKDGGKTINLQGDLVLSSQHIGTGKLVLNTTNTRTISGNGNGAITNIDFNGSADATVTVNCALRINGVFNFIGTNRRVWDMGTNGLVAASSATFTNTSTNRFIRFNGQQSAGGFTRIFSSNSFTFPIGSGTGGTYDYTPATLTLSATPSAYGSITIRPVASEHPSVTQTGRSLTYYWKISESGFTLGSASPSYVFTYLAADVVTGTGISEAGYVSARYDGNAISWFTGTTGNLNTTSKLITFASPTYTSLSGDFTAGDNSPVNPFGTVEVYYSRVNGDWNTLSTWTKNANHTTVNPPSTPPSVNSVVRIGNGASVFHTIQVSSNTATAGNLVIANGSTLNLNQTTGHNFVAIGSDSALGKGTLRIDRNGTTYAFPSGDFGNFLSAGGGEVEFYNSTANSVNLPSGISQYYALTLKAQGTGTIVLPNLNLLILDTFKISSTGSGACLTNTTNSANGNLDLRKGIHVVGGIFEIQNPGTSSAHVFTLLDNLIVDNGATFRVQNGGSNLVHTLLLSGDIVNNGTFDVFTSTLRYAGLEFIGNDTAYFTGTNGSAITDIYTLKLNKGTSQNAMLVLDVAGTLTNQSNGWLTLLNGTFRFAKAGKTLTIWNTDQSFEVPTSCALSVNNSTAVLGLGQANGNAADLLLGGKLELLSGTINLGISTNNTNNDIEYAPAGTPQIIISGGTLNVNGQIRRSLTSQAGALTYRQNGTSLVTVWGRNANNTRGKFEIINSNSVFEMSGNAVLEILRGGASSYPDLYIRPATSSVSGGTIRFQPSGSGNSTQTYSLDATAVLNSIEILSSGGNNATVDLNVNALTLLGNLTVGTNATLRTNNLNMAIAGRFEKTGTYTGGTAGVVFNGSASAISGNFSIQSIYRLTVDSSAALSVSGAGSSLRIDNSLEIKVGALLYDSAHQVDVYGSVTNNGEHISQSNTSSNTLRLIGSSVQQIYGTGIFGNLVIENTNDVFINSPMRIKNQLTLTIGVLDIAGNKLVFGPSSSISGTYSSTRMIRSNGVLSDGGVKRECSSGANNVYFPIGVSGKFAPARINITSSNSSGTVTVIAVNSKHPSTRVAADSQLNFYWQVDTTGFSALTVTHTYEYDGSFVSGDESKYVTGRFVAPSWSPQFGITGAINTTSNTITLSGVNYIHGGFTAGAPNEFGGVSTYYSRKSSGNWTDLDMWSTTGHTGSGLASAADLPVGAPIIIATGHTVYITQNSKLAESIQLVGTAVLDLSATYGHNVGTLSGKGRLRIKATGGGQFVFPAGNFTSFTDTGGGTVEYYDVVNGALPTQTTYNHLILSDGASRVQPNISMVVNGDLTISSGNLNNSSFNRTVFMGGNWQNNAGATGYIPGLGTVEFGSDTNQTITGVTNFYKLKLSGDGNKTLLDSIYIGKDLSFNGGLLFLGTNNLFMDSAAGILGNPYSSSMLVQNGSGRLMKKFISGGSFTFPIGELTGSDDYSPVALSFSSGDFTSNSWVSVSVTDAVSSVCSGVSNYLTRYWSFSSSGISNYAVSVTAEYVAADVQGTESLISGRMSRVSQPCLTGSAANTNNLSISFSGAVLNIFTGGEAPIAEPSIQGSLLFFTDIAPTSFRLTWTKGNGVSRIVVAKVSTVVNEDPVDLTAYTADSDFSGSPEDISNSNFVVYSGTDSNLLFTGLTPELIYHFAIYEYSNSGAESDYLLNSPLRGAMKTMSIEPTSVATTMTFSQVRESQMKISWSGGNGGKKLLVVKEGAPVSATPVDRVNYSASQNYAQADSIATAEYVVYQGSDDSVTVSGLRQNVYYHFSLFEWNGSDSATNYLTSTSLNDTQHTYLRLVLRVFLEGSFVQDSMVANGSLPIPKAQPYNNSVFNFSGFDSVQSIPNGVWVDWVMIELREAASPSSAIPSTIRGRAAGFVREDGYLSDTSASPGLLVKTTAPGTFYVVVHHRTHISIISSSSLTSPVFFSGPYSYNFAISGTSAYGTGALVDLGGGYFGMISGRVEDSNTSQIIDANDIQKVWNDRNKSGYQGADTNLDAIVDASDRSNVWNNRNQGSFVPD